MYKIEVIIDGTKVAACQCCTTVEEANNIKERLLECLKMPIEINIIGLS